MLSPCAVEKTPPMSTIHAVVDTSCIVKRYNALEPGRELLERMFARNGNLTIHLPHVCIAEVDQVFQRQRTAHGAPESLVQRMRQAFAHDIDSYAIHVYHVGGQVLTLTEHLMHQASPNGNSRQRAIMPIDRMVLAVALTLSRVMSGVVLVTADPDLEALANREKLHVWNPMKMRTIPRIVPGRRKPRLQLV